MKPIVLVDSILGTGAALGAVAYASAGSYLSFIVLAFLSIYLIIDALFHIVDPVQP